jgi:hypothetical protein
MIGLRLALLGACAGLWAVTSAWLFAGVWDPDDYLYARYANDWRIGAVALHDWYAPRVAVTLPAAAAFALFGVSDLSACAWPLLASAGTLVALFACVRRLHGEPAAWVAAALLATSPGFAFRGAALRPDAVLCFGLFGALAAWLEAEARPRGAARAGWLVLCGALAFVAHLARELALPLLGAFWLAYAAVTRSVRRDQAIAAAALLVLLALEAAWLARETGDPSFRFSVLSEYARGKDYPLRFGAYVAPLFQDWLRSARPLPVAWLAVPALVLACACALARRAPLLLLAWVLVGWLALELAPSQLAPYRPAFKEARYALPLVPLLAALTAFAITALFARRGAPRAVAIAVCAALVLGGLARAARAPQQRVLDALFTDGARLAAAQQPYRELANRLRSAPPGVVHVPPGLDGARVARAVAFHLGYPDDGSRDPGALVPGMAFVPMRGRGATLGTSGYAILRVAPGQHPRPGWHELARSADGNRALALYALGPVGNALP